MLYENGMHFANTFIPNEIIVSFLAYCTDADLLVVSKVNKQLNHQTELIWQQKVTALTPDPQKPSNQTWKKYYFSLLSKNRAVKTVRTAKKCLFNILS